ncbi:sulfatase-like hydrolase/transferase [Antarcticirhabdus aurantiaca]|uniref:Sulfatase-like hydrolase/transferase n=1 Tax=Antarcticirhabdus aurantiaca TaxID=2606717 RepID=A0ACD4NH82_9HYPH|nr:sulfatase-like hydrolase/transferase [Antarcticirhabdus aurantiaca]WAJ26173.1 sulfatase-like hydrolase/transferase [Jeongeuplla avenae]
MPASSDGRRLTPLRATFGAALLAAGSTLPAPGGGLPSSLPLEWPVAILLLVTAAPSRLLFTALRLLVTVAVALTVFLKLADLGTGLAFSRPFNPLLDASLLVSGWHLLSGTIGRGEALAVVVLALAAWGAATALLFWCFGGFRRLPRGPRRLVGGLAAAVVALWLVPSGPVKPEATRYLEARLDLVAQSVASLARFEDSLATDPLAGHPPETLFSALSGKDVMVLFVESYGRSAVEDPAYAGTTLSRLRAAESYLSAAGIGAVSGWLTSPTLGGQSWLAHGALLSGLWTSDQSLYDRMIASDRASLNALFRDAGWRTIAAMPAITMDWPEAGWFGYDAVFDAHNLGYRGKPFDWVTMPDQFTLAAIRRIVEAEHPRPVMVEAALISSHAPWTPLPRMVPWEDVGDGRIFDGQAASGEKPEVLWRDPARVRAAYGRSIDYALEAVFSYAATFGRNTVFVILGDHQPAPLITGEGAARDVPVHILSDDPAILRRFAGWNWTPGLVPAADLPPWRMDAFRERFAHTTSDSPLPSPEHAGHSSTP